MLLMILIDIVILLAVGIPILVLYRKWHAWAERDRTARLLQGRRRFGFRSWAARSFVIDAPIERVKEAIDGLPEMSYAEAAAMIERRGRAANFMALAPLTGKQVFETGIETEWIAPDTVEVRAHSYADWPINALDDADLPARQYQMMFEHAVVHIGRSGESRTKVSYELETPVWAYLLSGALVLLVGWVAWLIWRMLPPDADIGRTNIAVMSVLAAWVLTRLTEVLRMQSVALMDGIVATFGSPLPEDE